MLEWNEAYSTGFEDIDDQHKRLFQVINKLGEHIDMEKSGYILKETLDFLEDYIATHFAYEEVCMHKHCCPFANQNKSAHETFIAGYEEYRERYLRKGATKELVRDLHKEMEDWLVNHICRIDIHLKDCQPSHN